MHVVEAPARRRPRRPHRSWRQRAAIVAGSLLTGVLLVSACAVWYIERWYAGIDRITIVHASPTIAEGAGGASPSSRAAGGAATPTTEPYLGPSKAMNVLLTGSDGRACVAPDSPYAGAFLGNGSNTGDRSDTIILLHLDPQAKELALLSFPRDLWVPIAGGTRKDRINSAFEAEDPNPLIQTIESVFGVRIDHYIGVDFCAFKALVDATGGISIPFEAPARDAHTGLSVAEAGCHAMDGDEALAYVRSRYYQYQDERGRWVDDASSDYGRIARQQDFIRRLAARALDKGATNPLTAKRLLDVAHDNDVRIDDGLSLTDLVRIARAIRDLGPENAASYRVEGLGQVVGGASVIVPDLTSPAAKAILAEFRGLGRATTTTTPPTTSKAAGRTATTAKAPAPADTEPPAPAEPTTVPNNMRGVRPPPDVSCH
jgi:LCP family protein required for cell wall assembly